MTSYVLNKLMLQLICEYFTLDEIRKIKIIKPIYENGYGHFLLLPLFTILMRSISIISIN